MGEGPEKTRTITRLHNIYYRASLGEPGHLTLLLYTRPNSANPIDIMDLMDKIQGSTPLMVAKVAASRAIGAVSARAGHGGTNLPGRAVLALDKGIIGRSASGFNKGSIVVSATNGKTTTCAMIASILTKERLSVTRNREGANLAAGVASALLKESSMTGRPCADVGLFEVDEAAFPEVACQVAPRVALLMNLFRDQLDRYGELEHIAGLWRAALRSMSSSTTKVLNADDPLVAAMAGVRPEKTLYFGIEDTAAGSGIMQHASDSKYCTVCGHPFDYDAIYMGHMGRYHCSRCGNSRPSPTVYADEVELQGMHGSRFRLVTPAGEIPVEISLPGLYNLYNALAAAAACFALDIRLKSIVAGLAEFSAAFGRVEEISIDGQRVMLLLVKNPAGFNEVIRTLAMEPGKKTLMLALNDRIADGRDISWIWDADLEQLTPAAAHVVASGTRAWEMAMRLKYAGVSHEVLEVQPDLGQALKAALEMIGSDEKLYVLPTYTAMLALRHEISQHFRIDRQLEDLVWK